MAPDFHPKVNLPIIDKQRMAGGGGAEVNKITVHPEYNQLFNKDVRSPHVSPQSHSNVVQGARSPTTNIFGAQTISCGNCPSAKGGTIMGQQSAHFSYIARFQRNPKSLDRLFW